MTVTLTTWKKELMSFFFNPVAYVILVLFYLFRGFEVQALTYTWIRADADVDKFPVSYLLGPSMYVMVVLVPPILTMRCFAEERRSGSLEVLLTAPVRDLEIVLGKWLAAVTFFAILWLPTLAILWALTTPSMLATPMALGPVLAGYFGLALAGGMLLAVGCFTSSLTDNQLLASLSAILFNVGLFAAPRILSAVLADQIHEHEWVARAIDQVNISDHLTGWFMVGLVDTSRIVFFLAGTALFLFLTVKSLEARQWR